MDRVLSAILLWPATFTFTFAYHFHYQWQKNWFELSFSGEPGTFSNFALAGHFLRCLAVQLFKWASWWHPKYFPSYRLLSQKGTPGKKLSTNQVNVVAISKRKMIKYDCWIPVWWTIPLQGTCWSRSLVATQVFAFFWGGEMRMIFRNTIFSDFT